MTCCHTINFIGCAAGSTYSVKYLRSLVFYRRCAEDYEFLAASPFRCLGEAGRAAVPVINSVCSVRLHDVHLGCVP